MAVRIAALDDLALVSYTRVRRLCLRDTSKAQITVMASVYLQLAETVRNAAD